MVVHFDKIITNLKVSYFYLTILFARGRQYYLDSKLFTKCNTNIFLQNRILAKLLMLLKNVNSTEFLIPP